MQTLADASCVVRANVDGKVGLILPHATDVKWLSLSSCNCSRVDDVEQVDEVIPVLEKEEPRYHAPYEDYDDVLKNAWDYEELNEIIPFEGQQEELQYEELIEQEKEEPYEDYDPDVLKTT
ncbi:hypothetical protein L1987_23196 [Smallanthus sonchifolius]|uniref:Uncharacterized protein n=1 Tax=Smallanthus sonchifolius TaxID=185202 RepID=A0ACB9IIF7_9ASTR|nr:hypothetical protein L1987_23196 [Smallanthus sonchifolius]